MYVMADLITSDDSLKEEDPTLNLRKSDTAATVIQYKLFRYNIP